MPLAETGTGYVKVEALCNFTLVARTMAYTVLNLYDFKSAQSVANTTNEGLWYAIYSALSLSMGIHPYFIILVSGQNQTSLSLPLSWIHCLAATAGVTVPVRLLWQLACSLPSVLVAAESAAPCPLDAFSTLSKTQLP